LCLHRLFCAYGRVSATMLRMDGPHKNKNPIRGDCFLLDLWSWRESNPRPNMGIICFLHAYSCLIFVTCQLQNNLTCPYFLFVSPSGRNNLQTSPGLRASPYRVGSGHDRPGNVSSQHMCRENPAFAGKCLSYCYSLMLRERNCFRLLLFCDTV
jgi:hypothetical protein